MEKILVVAAVIERGGRVLLCRRPRAKRHGGLWEFPGGKLHDGESLEDGLRRELREELSVELLASGATLFTSHDYGSPFEIHFVGARIAGEPLPIEHEELAWVAVADCDKYELAPSDLEFVTHYGRGRVES